MGAAFLPARAGEAGVETALLLGPAKAVAGSPVNPSANWCCASDDLRPHDCARIAPAAPGEREERHELDCTDYKAITQRQQGVWTSGDFGRVGTLNVLHGELLCESLDLHPGERVLDVAGGNGTATLAAARRWADVTCTDFVPELLEQAKRRAASEGMQITTQVADAQNLPFDDDSYDVVISTFGAMFAPDQQRVADELVRVCRRGGRIGMCNWAPGSMMHEVFRTTGQHVPPPPGVQPVFNWGDEAKVRELLGGRVSSLKFVPRNVTWRFHSPEHMLEYMRDWYGPTKVAFGALDGDGQAALAADLLEVYRKHNRSGDDTLVAPSAYVEVIAVKAD
jgi:SAM-dependent methyltransferase